MIDLLKNKLELVNKIEELTHSILDIQTNNEYNEGSLSKINEFIDKRQNLMNEIDNIDICLKSGKSRLISIDTEIIKSKTNIESNIKSSVKRIIDMDKYIKLNTEKQLVLTKKSLNEVDKKLQTSDFTLNKEDKKPIGYFLNKKS